MNKFFYFSSHFFFFFKEEPSFFITSNSFLITNHKSSAISYRNRFLVSKNSLVRKVANFFNYNGNLKTAELIFLNYYYYFCKSIFGLYSLSPHNTYIKSLLVDSPEFLRLFFSNSFLKDFSRAYLYRCSDLVPNIKAISRFKKQKKQKKIKKIKKYQIEYKLIKPVVRLQVLNRWLASLLKLESFKLINSIEKIIPLVLIKPQNSKLSTLRYKIYSGMSLQ